MNVQIYRGICRMHPLTRCFSTHGSNKVSDAKQKYVWTSGKHASRFRVSSVHVGIKASNTNVHDVALITSDIPCEAAGTFTKNMFQAAPVTISRQRLLGGASGIRNVVVNSGCANAVTGKAGLLDAQRMCEAADSAVGSGNASQLGTVVMSTGVIGQRLPIDKIIAGIPAAAKNVGDSHDHWLQTAQAICTTDTFPKLRSRYFSLPGVNGQFVLTGIAKGAGMIHPNMGTLLAVICTDAPISAAALTDTLRNAVQGSFNHISIDGDTSTNDTVICLANGAASDRIPSGNPLTLPGQNKPFVDQREPMALAVFQQELLALCRDLAKLIVRDGEGATKFVTIRVRGASNTQVGRAVAKSIAKSSLVKTALYGEDANWGRILCAIGYSPFEAGVPESELEPEKISVSFVPVMGELQTESDDADLEELKLLVNGEPQVVDEARAARLLREEELEILVRLQPQPELNHNDDVVYWTCDLSHEYVTINGSYRT